MSWSYSSGTLTASGGTETSPNKISVGVETVISSDAAKGEIVYAADGATVESCKLIDVVIDVPSGSWVSIDSDIQFIMQGATHFTWHQESSNNANDGGSFVFEERATIYINTNVNYTESTTRFNNGCSCIIKQDKYKVNPRIVLNAPNRHDIITFAGQSVNKVDIQGLNIHQIGGGSPSLKWFLGYARNLVNFKDVTFDSNGEVFQLIYVTVDNPKVKTNAFASTSRTGNPQYVYVNNPTFIWTSDQIFKGNIRSAKWTTKNPNWSDGKWNGAVNWNAINASNYPRFWIVYENTILVFKASDSSGLQGATVYLERIIEGTDYYSGNVDEHAATYTLTTDTSGKVQKDLLDAYCAVSDGTNEVTDVERYKWSCQVRHYNYLNTSQYVYQNRVYASENSIGTGPKTDTVFMANDDGVTLTQTNAASLTEANSFSDVYDLIKDEWVTSGNYWNIDLPLLKNGTVLDFGNNTITFNTSANNRFNINGSDVTVKTGTTLTKTVKYNEVKATSITYDSIIIDDGSNFTGNVYINSAQNLSDVIINGDLHVKIAANTILDFTNVIVTGNMFNDDASHTLTINALGSSSLTAGDAGTGNGQTNIQNNKLFTFTLNPSVTGYEWRIYTINAKGSLTGASEIAGEENATSDTQTYSYNYTSDQIIAVQILATDQDYVESVTYYDLTNNDQSVTINLKKDENN